MDEPLVGNPEDMMDSEWTATGEGPSDPWCLVKATARSLVTATFGQGMRQGLRVPDG